MLRMFQVCHVLFGSIQAPPVRVKRVKLQTTRFESDITDTRALRRCYVSA